MERHGPDVWRVVRSLHRHHQEAEDAYQDAWLHLRSAAAPFRPGPGGGDAFWELCLAHRDDDDEGLREGWLELAPGIGQAKTAVEFVPVVLQR